MQSEDNRGAAWVSDIPDRKKWWPWYMNRKLTERTKKMNEKNYKVSSRILNILDEADSEQLRSYIKKYGKRHSSSAMPDERNAELLEAVNAMEGDDMRQYIAMSLDGDDSRPLIKANVENYFKKRMPNNSKTARNFKEIFNKPKKSWFSWGSRGGKRKTRKTSKTRKTRKL
jgi:hypothetical protein